MRREKQLLIKLTPEEDLVVKELRGSGINISQFVRNSIISYYNRYDKIEFPSNFQETSLVLALTG